jgi:hypothetical protein
LSKRTILFLAANPLGTDRLALDEECAAIERELRMTSGRDDFDFRSKWAVSLDELMRHLNELQPTIVHFSGHGGRGELPLGSGLEETFGAALARTKLVILNACYNHAAAEELLPHVACVLGTSHSIRRDAARSFAAGFYRALAENESVAVACQRGGRVLDVGLDAADRPQLKVRKGVDANQIFLTGGSPLIDFWTERQRHAGFIGREDILGRIDEWFLGSSKTTWVVITGGPGTGKSAILSAWLARREAAGAVVPHHFVRRWVDDWGSPGRIVASLASQIEGLVPGLGENLEYPRHHLADPRHHLADPRHHLAELLGQASKRLDTSSPLIIVVDGLDEAHAVPGENPLPRFLPDRVPPGIRFLCAMRPVEPQLSWLQARSRVRSLDLDDPRWAASHEAVVQAFWERVSNEYHPPLQAEEVDAAIFHSDGNMLRAVNLHGILRAAPSRDEVWHGFIDEPLVSESAIRIRKTVEADWQDSAPVLRLVRILCRNANTALRSFSLEDIRQMSGARDAHEAMKIAEYLASERIGLLVAHFTLVRPRGSLELSDQGVQGALRSGVLRDPETGRKVTNWQKRVLLSYQISAIRKEQR